MTSRKKPRISLRTLARLAGGSVSTASRALHNHPVISAEVRQKRRAAPSGRDSAVAAYSIHAGSAAIGAGVALPDHPARDFAGQPVIVREGRVDIGAIGSKP